jgi:hypothetical protein
MSQLKVMISSTARDLPEHRKEALDACQRQSMFPIMMEYLPASDDEAISISLKMVDEADIYVGIFAFRYGTVPKGYDISITEMEYNRAKKRGIPCLIFLIHDDHPIKAADVEKGEGAVKLEAFKKRVSDEKIINKFISPADLRAHMINSLSKFRETDAAGSLHYVSDIPEPPETYIAHPYTLLQTSQLVGRREELNLLTDWVAKPSSLLYHARIFNVVAIGGMGKSAMTWKWFNDIAPQEMNPLAGRMWWSFYESDARFENFVTRALAYVSRKPREEIEKLPPPERETQLLRILNDEPFLLVLDGLERILIAYARMDAAHLSDDDLDQQTANFVAGIYGLPESAGQSFVGQHRLRKTADVRVGQFLRKLAHVNKSRILVSTRLYPADLQLDTGAPIAGCAARFLEGLSEDDALEVWRSIKGGDSEGNELQMKGARDALLPLFRQFENYPLLIRALAGEVANYHRAPGDFDKWRSANPDFTPVLMKLRHEDAKSHVLKYALQNLDEKSKQVLHTIAAFRAPANYDTLAALMVEGIEPPVGEKNKDEFDFDDAEAEKDEEQVKEKPPKLFASEPQLDAALTELEDRGLLGWDKRANRYDLHPIVRGVTWANVDKATQQGVYATLHGYFAAVPLTNQEDVESLDDLTPAIELYDKLVRMGRYDDAGILFYERINKATLYRLSAARQRAELLEMLFPSGLDKLPLLSKRDMQRFTLNALALAYQYSGQARRAVPLYRLHNELCEKDNDQSNLGVGLGNLSNALRLSAGLREAEFTAWRVLGISREQDNRFQVAISLYWLGLGLAARGLQFPSHQRDELRARAVTALHRSLKIFITLHNTQSEGVANAYLAQAALWRGDDAAARLLANQAWELAKQWGSNERDFIRSARLQGAAVLGLGDFDVAEERLHHALPRARAVNYAEEELPALIALAELERQRGKPALAREYLDDVWEGAERGPYPLFHADALNVLAQIERDAGNTAAAIKAATQAYEKAWCDGISADGKSCYAYGWGLQKAKAHLDALGAPYPDLPPFDESKFEPLPDVEINPHDEYYVDESELD